MRNLRKKSSSLTEVLLVTILQLMYIDVVVFTCLNLIAKEKGEAEMRLLNQLPNLRNIHNNGYG